MRVTAALHAVVILACACAFYSCVKASDKLTKITIDGSVEVAHRDVDGRITDIQIESKKGSFLWLTIPKEWNGSLFCLRECGCSVKW